MNKRVPAASDCCRRGHVLTAVQNDYKQMRNMFFGEVPELAVILDVLRELESEINQAE